MIRPAVPWFAAVVVVSLSFSAAAFETNGKKWAEMPVQFFINPEQCPILSNPHDDEITILEIMEKVTDAWSSVPCADVSFQFMGTTDAVWEADGQNTIYCINVAEDWAFGVGAAGATLWLPYEEGGPLEVDMALNAVDFEWVIGGGDATQADVFDPLSVITHEMGHVLGLAHSPDPFATMHQYSIPFGIQGTLDADDKAGICSVYPIEEMECETDDDCPKDQECRTVEGWSVCGDLHDPPGSFCNKDYMDCEGMCWVSPYECTQFCFPLDIFYNEGYCAEQCDEDGQCAEGHLPTEQPIGVFDVCLCLIDPDYNPPEPGPEAAVEPGPEAVVEIVEEVVGSPEAFDAVTTPPGDSAGEDEVSGSVDLSSHDVKVEKKSKSSGGCASLPTSGSRAARGAGLLFLAFCFIAVMRRSRVNQ